MNKTLIFMMLVHTVDVLVSFTVLGMFLFDITGERLQLQKLGKYVLFSGLSAGSIGFVLVYMSTLNGVVSYLLSSNITLAFATVGMSFLWKYDPWRSLSAVCIGGMLQVCCGSVVASIIKYFFFEYSEDAFLYYGGTFVIYLAIGAGISLLLRKMQFSRLIRYMLDGGWLPLKAVSIFVLEMMVEIFFVMGRQLQEETIITYNAGMVMLTLLLVGILLHVSGKEESERKIQYQESLILQQQLYVEQLEQMQKEMRVFRHDYKNILSGMYLYAKEGDADKIQDVLERLEIDFDQKIGEKIHAATQIGNICMPELKSLVLSKLTKMNKNHIACRLEVLYPINSFGMDVWDFNQCLGILLDNAIEAAAIQPEPYVELQLMYQEGFFTVRVANPWKQEVDLSHMWKEGYSTKGEKRGVGLSNYKRVLKHYPQAVSATSWEDEVFVQELTVPV
ncbi:MAG: GHKL domain-containing protein [Eubacterium sp.]|nr:GHKL domain-containing protein [Eubacterium sp.]